MVASCLIDLAVVSLLSLVSFTCPAFGDTVETVHVSPTCSSDPALEGLVCLHAEAINKHGTADESEKLIVIVHQGVYRNSNWRNDSDRKFYLGNTAVLTINNKKNIEIVPADASAQRPKNRIDGSGGNTMSRVSNIIIRGLEIVGPSERITGAEASLNRKRLTSRDENGKLNPCSEGVRIVRDRYCVQCCRLNQVHVEDRRFKVLQRRGRTSRATALLAGQTARTLKFLIWLFMRAPDRASASTMAIAS